MRLADVVTHAYSRQMWHLIVSGSSSWPLTPWMASNLAVYGSGLGLVTRLWCYIASLVFGLELYVNEGLVWMVLECMPMTGKLQ
jgi:hypothetical protein